MVQEDEVSFDIIVEKDLLRSLRFLGLIKSGGFWWFLMMNVDFFFQNASRKSWIRKYIAETLNIEL